MLSETTRTVTAVATEPCSVFVMLFPLTIVTLTAEPRVRYTLYPQPRAGQNAWPSGRGGAHGRQRLQLCMVQLVDTSPLTTCLSTKNNPKIALPPGDSHAGLLTKSPDDSEEDLLRGERVRGSTIVSETTSDDT